MSDVNQMLIEDSAAFGRQEFLKKQATPLDQDEIDLIVDSIATTSAKLNRLCNLLLNRPSGISLHALQALQHLKIDVSWLKWHMETQRLPADATQAS